MSYIILTAFMVAIVYRYLTHKSLYVLLMFSSLFCPIFQLLGIDGAYIIMILLMILLLHKRKIKSIPKYLKYYVYLNIIVALIEGIAWLIYSRQEWSILVTIYAGSFKLCMFMIAVWELDEGRCKADYEKEVVGFISLTVVVNTIAVIYEMFDYAGSVKMLSNIFLNASEIEYLGISLTGRSYVRYYGLFGYSMNMGVFIVIALAFLFNEKKYLDKNKKMLLILLCVFLGVSSGTKTFFLGIVVVVFLQLCMPVIYRGFNIRIFLWIGVIAVSIVLFFIFYDQIYKFIVTFFGGGVAYRFSFLRNWRGSLSTRFSKTGVLNGGLDFLWRHIFIGAGPVSIEGEAVMDNAFYVILHNGGIIAFISVMLFYFCIGRKWYYDMGKIILILSIFICSIGFQTLIATNITTWIIYYLCVDKRIAENHPNEKKKNIKFVD